MERKNELMKYFCYIISIFFIFFGLMGLTFSFGCIFFILAGLLILPYTKKVLEKNNIKLSRNLKISITIIFVFLGIMIVSKTSPDITSKNTINVNQTNSTETVANNNILETKDKELKENTVNNNKDDAYKKDPNISNTNIVNNDFGESMINELKNLEFNIEEATKIQSIFYKIGINSISNIEKGLGDGIDKLQSFTAYANNDTKKKFYFTIDNRKLYYAGFRDETLYDSTKGGILNNINNVHIPETSVDMSTYTTLQVKAQETVKQYLNYPNTSNFSLYDGWGIARSDDKYKIIGKVEAQNGFGVKSDINFSVWFTKINNDFTIEAIEMDGIRVK